MLAHEFSRDMLAGLVLAGLATVVTETVRAGGPTIKLERVRITDVRVRQAGVDLYHADLRNHKPTQTATARVDPDGLDPDVPAIGPVCDAELPWSIQMQVPHTEQDVIFQYKEAKWNPPIIPGAFKMVSPDGVRSMFVTCGKEAKP